MKKINYLAIAKKSAAIQISELKKINKVFNKNFVKAVEAIHNSKGKVVCSGVGKSGLIARKISATLSSVGISSFFLDSSNASHGDLGQVEKRDVLILFSYSGNTAELTNLIKYASRFNILTIGIASQKNSMLIKSCDIPILLPQVKEADLIGMVPSTSTTITLLVGDCLAVALMNKQKFSKERFRLFHPGGSIGSALLLVKDIMVSGSKLPIISPEKNIAQAIKVIKQKKLGIVIVQKNKKVFGFCTDGDVRRGYQTYDKNQKVSKIMTKNPLFVTETTLAAKALAIMNENKITSLLVFKDNNSKKLVGIVHIHELLKYGIR